MERLPHPGPEPAVSAAEPPRLPRAGGRLLRRSIHALLFPATFLTLAFTGGVLWVGAESLPEDAPSSTLFRWEFLGPLLLSGLPYALWVTAILGSHEMGHWLACRFYRIPASLPFFIPGIPPIGSFGAVIRIRGPIPHRRALFDVAAAGPIAGFLVALPVLLVGLALAEPVEPAQLTEGEFGVGPPLVLWLLGDLFDGGTARTNAMIGAGWVGMLVTSLNLFPVGQLDGGHAAYALSRRLHRALTRGTLIALLALILVQALMLRQIPAYVLWFAVLLWMRDRHPRLLDEETFTVGPVRRLLAVALAAMLFLSFIPVPFVF